MRKSRIGHKTRLAASLALVVGLGAAVLPAVAPLHTESAAAAAQGCGYASATPNNGKFASTICWFDFTAFNETLARTPAGQPLTVTLEGGYVATFTVKITNVPGLLPMGVERRTTPLETRFAFGSIAYQGVPGLHSLYSLPSPAGVKAAKLSFENITVVDSANHPVSGFSFVAADTEDNVLGESFIWTSDKPITEIERLAPNGNWGCKTPVGLGTTTVSCAGTGAGGTTIPGGRSTALLVAADSPTTFATQWQTGARSGIAIGIQTSKLTLVKNVVGRINPADSFDIQATNSAGATIGSSSTSTGSTATTGPLNVVAGGSYTLTEAVTPGSPTVLANYRPTWSCVNLNPSSATVLPSGAGTTKNVTPALGDDITCTLTNTAATPAISLIKRAGTPTDVNANGLTDAGDTIAYEFDVTNSGQTRLENVAVQDAKAGAVTCPPGILGSGESITCAADDLYVITGADEAAGFANNTATASGLVEGSTFVVLSEPSLTSTPVTAPAPEITIVKSASPSNAAAYTEGQVITYSFVVRNTGNVALTDVAIVETGFSGSGALGPITCPPGFGALAIDEEATCTATYTLTQDDVDAGTLENSVRATGDPVGDEEPIESPESEFAVPVDAAPAVTLAKTVTPATATNPGDLVTYSFAVTNAGNVTLSDASIDETAFSGTGTAPSIVCPAGPFLPGATVTCTADYTLTQADVDAGTVTNTATASADWVSGTDPVSEAASATVTIPAVPDLTLEKSADLVGDGVAGDSVNYSFLVTNSGNVTITGLAIDEQAFSGQGSLSAIQCPDTTLGADESTTCTAQYTLTQADVDAGEVTNTATATGTRLASTAPVSSNPSSAEVETLQTAGIGLVKSVLPTTVNAVDDTVTYSFAVTNTGTVTLSGAAIDETAFSGTGAAPVVICPEDAFAPTATVTCTASYTVSQADVDAGTITNTATATATPLAEGVEAPVSEPSSAAVTATQAPALTILKSASPSATFAAGQSITYTFVVTNTGNVTLSDVGVDEATFTGTGTLGEPTCDDAAQSLPPGAQTICTLEYVLTQADVDADSLTNSATATGTPPNDGEPPVSPPSEITIPELASPAVSLVKSTETTAISRAGQTIEYRFTVTNTGNTTLFDPVIAEGAFSGAGSLPQPTCPVGSVAPGQFVVCTTTYTVVPADLTGKPLTNTATATAEDPDGEDVASEESTAEIEDVAIPRPLASTGLDVRGWLASGIVAMLAGGAVLLVGRRRRRGNAPSGA